MVLYLFVQGKQVCVDPVVMFSESTFIFINHPMMKKKKSTTRTPGFHLTVGAKLNSNYGWFNKMWCFSILSKLQFRLKRSWLEFVFQQLIFRAHFGARLFEDTRFIDYALNLPDFTQTNIIQCLIHIKLLYEMFFTLKSCSGPTHLDLVDFFPFS